MPIILNIKLATCGITSVPKTPSDAQVCLTEGHDSKSSSQDQSCTVVESTSGKEAASGSCDQDLGLTVVAWLYSLCGWKQDNQCVTPLM